MTTPGEDLAFLRDLVFSCEHLLGDLFPRAANAVARLQTAFPERYPDEKTEAFPARLRRNKWIYEQYKSGRLLKDIAKELGISPARVSELKRRWEMELKWMEQRKVKWTE